MITKVNDYNIVGSYQFPKEGNYTSGAVVGNYYGKYAVQWPIVVNDFEQEVRDLHEFLYQDGYEPSDFIKSISYQMTLDRLGQ